MVPSLTGADTVELPLPAGGSLSVRTLPGPHGRARYIVRGRRVHGTLVVIPHTTYDGPVLAEEVRVQFGACDGREHVPHGQSRADEPVVGTVRVHGHTAPIDPRTVTAGTPFLGGDAVAVRDDGHTRRIPDGARTVLEAVVVTVVQHWQQRRDRDALVLAARPPARHPAALARPGLAHALDGDGSALGVVTVHEREVIASMGRVVYDVHGARIHGQFAVGTDRYSDDPVPGGIYVIYGRPTGTD
ncbi:hypothetical protein ACWD25_43650 [Streptomyces sp. NPDC002920]